MWALYKKELLLFFKTTTGYLFLAFFLFFTGLVFSISFLFKDSTAFANYLQNITILFTLIAPLLTMKIFTDERRYKTDQLILTAPIAVYKIVLAKFSSVLTILLLICLIISTYLIVLAAFGSPDWPRIISAYLGFILLGMSLLSIGLFVSSSTTSQMSAALATFAIVAFMLIISAVHSLLPRHIAWGVGVTLMAELMIASWVNKQNHQHKISLILLITLWTITIILAIIQPQLFRGLLGRLMLAMALPMRFRNFSSGIIILNDVVFYLSITAFFLYLTVWRIERYQFKEE
jgi:ABC-2 type transport system permease protein